MIHHQWWHTARRANVLLALLAVATLGCSHAAGEPKEMPLDRPLTTDGLLRVVRGKSGMDQARVVKHKGNHVVVHYRSEGLSTDPSTDRRASGHLSGTITQYDDPPRIVYHGRLDTVSPIAPAEYLMEAYFFAETIAERCATAARVPPKSGE